MKRKLIYMSLLSLLVIGPLFSQEKDINAIKSMCGCYEVGFNFAETFNYADDSTYLPSKVKHASGLEWVQLVEEDDDFLSLQHLLIVGPDTNQMIIKHWRQDWAYENQKLYVYDHDNQWTYVEKPADEVDGQWTQKVFQVDDSPRYEGTASWVHIDGRSYWENTTDAPLPRREYTQRSDYNVTIRSNRHEITEDGWIHDQDNMKVMREEGAEDKILAEEKGFNVYKKVDDSKCKAAQDWWKENDELWARVRAVWNEIYAQNKDLKLKEKVDGKPIFKALFSLENDASEEEIKKILMAYVA